MKRADLIKKHKNIYMWLLNNNRELLDEIFPNERTHWTQHTCLSDAMKHSSLKEWRQNSPSGYVSAKNKGFLKEIKKELNWNREYIFWTKEDCKEYALNYATKEQWKKGHRKTWECALKKGWQLELCCHMKKNACEVFVKNLNTNRIFESVTKAGVSIGQKRGSNISSVCRGKQKTAGGFRWAYCDEHGNVVPNND